MHRQKNIVKYYKCSITLQTLNLQSVAVRYGNLHSFRLHTPSVGLFTFRQSKNLSIIAMKSLVSLVVSWSMYVNALATVSLRTYQFTKVSALHNTANKQQFRLHKTAEICNPAVHCTTRTVHCTTQNYTTLYYNSQHYVQHNTKHHYTTVQYTTLHYSSVHYTTLQLRTLHNTALQFRTLHNTTLQFRTLNYTTLHCSSVHYTTLHYS